MKDVRDAVFSMPRSPINVAARRSGLTPHVIRAWERRYGAVAPDRTDTARRLYSEWEIQRLVLLRQAVDMGHRIGEIARLPTEELHALVGRDTLPGIEASPRIPLGKSRLVGVAVEATREMDAATLQQALLQATRSMSIPDLFETFVSPLLDEIGERWRTGDLRVAHEHFASAHLRTFLGDLLGNCSVAMDGPAMVITTPQGQAHELGAMMVAVAARRLGWNAVYLGPNLPAEEIVHVIEARQARALALSLCYPSDDVVVPTQLLRMRRLLGPQFPIFVGGQSVAGYRDALQEIGAIIPTTLDHFALQLTRLRAQPLLRA